jgi:hypothetical protein
METASRSEETITSAMLGSCSQPGTAHQVSRAGAGQFFRMGEVDWRDDADAAFAQHAPAATGILCWGALWCPPCNRIKSTTFARQFCRPGQYPASSRCVSMVTPQGPTTRRRYKLRE